MDIYLKIILLVFCAYLSGSLPFGLWITRMVKGVDVREVGSGHVTTTNTIRQAGWVPGLFVFVLDVGKGFLPVYLAQRADLPVWAIAVVAGVAVVGHCWSVFAQFQGGMGLAVSGGGFLAIAPLAFPIGLALLILLTLLLKHSARAALITGLAIPLVLYGVGLRGTIVFVAMAAGLVIAIRFTIDWNREYRELWLDREDTSPHQKNKLPNG